MLRTPQWDPWTVGPARGDEAEALLRKVRVVAEAADLLQRLVVRGPRDARVRQAPALAHALDALRHAAARANLKCLYVY